MTFSMEILWDSMGFPCEIRAIFVLHGQKHETPWILHGIPSRFHEIPWSIHMFLTTWHERLHGVFHMEFPWKIVRFFLWGIKLGSLFCSIA